MISKDEAKNRISKLVEQFKKDLENGKAHKYTEEETKVKYIQPLFEALGWDFSAKTDDISLEERISGKRVDYGFRINGIPKFYVEAKKVKENLDKIEFAEQAINYAWHKGCTWAILTDFETLKIFNSEWKYKGDPSINKFKEIKYWDYIERFNELWLLSKESMNMNELDKAAEKVGKIIKKQDVGKQMYDDLLMWRTALSKDIVKQNPKKFDINSDELDEVVQRILDRFIFIRTVEDRGIHTDVKLIEIVRDFEKRKRGKIIKKINELFNEYDDVFNSRLFQSGHFSEQVDISNEVLFKVVKGLYHTEDKSIHYDFAAINADVLGNVYEQYLGHLLKKTAKRAKIEKSKSKRKEQGIYYTPNYIVDYIVRNTVGEYIKGRNKKTVEKIKILDPACGSGSFLIRAFDEVDMYWKRNLKEDIYKQTKLSYDDSATHISKKIEILRDNIYGVDLDEQAVEIARLNLLIKAAERKHLLPALDQNIKNGNSLIDDPSVAGSKAFKWEEEFEAIMKDGGFDVIIGNPPYGIVYDLNQKKYLETQFQTFKRNNDLYVAFIEKSISLLKEGGYFAFIIPNTYLVGSYFNEIKNHIKNNSDIVKIINFGNNEIFKDPNVFNSIIILRKRAKISNKNTFLYFEVPKYDLEKNNFEKISNKYSILQNSLGLIWKPKNKIIEKINNNKQNLIDDLFHVKDVGFNYWTVGRGKQRGGSIGSKVFYEGEKLNVNDIPYLKGRNIFKYGYKYGNHWLKYDYEKYLNKEHDIFRFNSDFLETSPKIIYRQTSDKIIATIDFKKYYLDKTVHMIIPKIQKMDLFVLLGIINSKLMLYYYKNLSGESEKTFAQVKTIYVKQIPLYFNSQLENEIKKHVLIQIENTRNLLSFDNKQTDAKIKVEEEIKKTEQIIDNLVYKLYEITEEEKKIIEESLNE